MFANLRPSSGLSLIINERVVPLPVAAATAPRIDTVLRDGRVLIGVPTPGATLSNLLGAHERLEEEVEAYVLIPAGATDLTPAQIAPNLHTRAINDSIARIVADLHQSSRSIG